MAARKLIATTMLAGALAGLAAWPAASQTPIIELEPPPPEQPAGPPPGRATVKVFISPAGEPFRSRDGDSPLTNWFLAADQNADGFLDLDEFTDDHMRFFDILDQNHDGVIAGPEVTRYEQEIAPEILAQFDRSGHGPEGGGPPGGGMGPPPGGRPHGGRHGGKGGEGGDGGFAQGAARYGLLKEVEPVRAADTDLDFRVTREEWRAAAASRLKRLDTNGDGLLHLTELQLQAPLRPGQRRRRPPP